MRAKSGVTIEVNNTDAEGRLVLADCLAHAIDLGAERLVDLATLTGAIVVALGRTYAGLFANDDAWAGEILAAGARTGEQVWRMPLHAEYAKLIEGRYADIVNSPADRGARRRSPPPSSCTASPATCRGRTWTSPAPPTTTASPTRPRAARAGASACSSSWRGRTGRARPALHLKGSPGPHGGRS